MYRVVKTYGHNLGLSTTFRQWRASSHCRFLHGYSLQIEVVFAAPLLNDNNWVIDFGSLKPFKAWLGDTFDHQTLIAADDPQREHFIALEAKDLIQIKWVPATGCEGFSRFIYNRLEEILREAAEGGRLQGGYDNGVFIESVEVREHGGNAAKYSPSQPTDLMGNLVHVR